jgi:hypothetical protein
MDYKFNYGSSRKMPWDLPFSFFDDIISKFGNVFSTTDLTDLWIDLDPVAAKEYEEMRGRNWRAVVGKRLKQYSIEREKIEQITPGNVTPARWRKQ